VSFFGELRRRNVVKVAVAYAIVGWLLIEIASTVLPTFEAPLWVLQSITFAIILGFPLAVVLSWVFDLTPQGVERTRSTPPTEGTPTATGRQLDFAIIGALVFTLGFVVYNYESEDAPASSPEIVVDEVIETPPVVVEEQREVLPNSVAVLPLENLSLNPEDAFFAAGIHDELLNQLAKISDLNVIARTSVLRYADKGETSIPEIANELKVKAVMEGTVRYGGGRVRITTQLIDGDSNTHLWSETYESAFDVENIFAIESDIAMQIAAALEAELLPAEQARIEKLPTDSTEALTLYLRAKASISDLGPFLTPEEISNFHRYLDRALLADPEFALAHAWKAYEYAFSIGRTFQLSDDGATAQREALVLDHAQTALALDPDVGFAYGALAWPHVYGHRRAEAQEAWERAYELSPRDPDIVVDFGFFSSTTGQTEQAMSLARQALDLAPNSAQTVTVAGVAFIVSGDYDTAARIEHEAIALDPIFFLPYLWLGLVEAARGNDAEALEQLRFAEELSQGIPSPDIMSQLVYGYGLIGRRDDATRVFSRIESMAAEFHVGAPSWTMAYLGTGDEARALDSLTMAAETSQGGEGFVALTLLLGNAFNDPVLEQPAFVGARRRIGLRDL